MRDMGSIRDEIMQLFASRARYGLFAEVGRFVGVTGQTVGEWARGEVIPTEEYWPKLESYFGLKAGHLARNGPRPTRRSGRVVSDVAPTAAHLAAQLQTLIDQAEQQAALIAELGRRVDKLERKRRSSGAEVHRPASPGSPSQRA